MVIFLFWKTRKECHYINWDFGKNGYNRKRGNDDDTQHLVEADGLEKDEAGMLLALFTIKVVLMLLLC